MHNSFRSEIKAWSMKNDSESKENNQDTANLQNN
jgi:hypothetical protein